MTADLTIFMVRHGQAKNNLLNTVGGPDDSPLTSIGMQQAAAIGRWLGAQWNSWCRDPVTGQVQERPDAIYSSPLERARRTGEIALAEMGIDQDIIIAPELRELHQGEATGRDRQDVWTMERKATLAWLNLTDPEAAWRYKPFPSSESPYEAAMRMLAWAEELGGVVLAFGHRNTTLAAAGRVKRYLQYDTFTSSVYPNTGIYRFRRRGGVWVDANNVYCPEDVACIDVIREPSSVDKQWAEIVRQRYRCHRAQLGAQL